MNNVTCMSYELRINY